MFASLKRLSSRTAGLTAALAVAACSLGFANPAFADTPDAGTGTSVVAGNVDPGIHVDGAYDPGIHTDGNVDPGFSAADWHDPGFSDPGIHTGGAMVESR